MMWTASVSSRAEFEHVFRICPTARERRRPRPCVCRPAVAAAS